MESTLGFSPIIQHKILTDTMKQKFVVAVNDNLNKKTGTDVKIDNEKEVIDILDDIARKTPVTKEVLQEAIDYATSMLMGRINMHNHLNSIKDNMIRLQPRGTCDREKGCLPMMNTHNPGKTYLSFLEEQKKYRDSF